MCRCVNITYVHTRLLAGGGQEEERVDQSVLFNVRVRSVHIWLPNWNARTDCAAAHGRNHIATTPPPPPPLRPQAVTFITDLCSFSVRALTPTIYMVHKYSDAFCREYSFVCLIFLRVTIAQEGIRNSIVRSGGREVGCNIFGMLIYSCTSRFTKINVCVR